jgi:hypothetical protein
MARISRAELVKRLDEVSSMIEKDNVGYIITDSGKDAIVLCPARWINCMFDMDFGCIMNSALRYAIGRRTYMPTATMNFIRRYIDVLDTRTLSVMISDIEREVGHETLEQRDDWLQLRDDLKIRYDMMLKKNDETLKDKK